MPSRRGQIKTFQLAFQGIGKPLLFHTTQFYHVKEHRVVTQYHIKRVVIDEETGRSYGEEIFNTYYQMYVIFFLRDLWYKVQGIPLDTSNQYWEDYKRKYNINIEDVIL